MLLGADKNNIFQSNKSTEQFERNRYNELLFESIVQLNLSIN